MAVKIQVVVFWVVARVAWCSWGPRFNSRTGKRLK